MADTGWERAQEEVDISAEFRLCLSIEGLGFGLPGSLYKHLRPLETIATSVANGLLSAFPFPHPEPGFSLTWDGKSRRTLDINVLETEPREGFLLQTPLPVSINSTW